MFVPPRAWRWGLRTAPCFRAYQAVRKTRLEAVADAHAVHTLGCSDGHLLGMVLPVGQRHEFRLCDAEPTGARFRLPALWPDAWRRPGHHPGHGGADLRFR